MSSSNNKNSLEKKNINSDENNKEDDMQLKLEKSLLELKILSNVKEFDKLSIRDNLVIDSPHILQSISRKIGGDSRNKTINYIDLIINDIFSILDFLLEDEIEKAEAITIINNKSNHYNNYSNYSNYNTIINKSKTHYNNQSKDNKKKFNFKDKTINIYQTITQNLTESISGLQNLKITYLNDITMTSKLDMLIVKIQNRISKINNMMVLNP